MIHIPQCDIAMRRLIQLCQRDGWCPQGIGWDCPSLIEDTIAHRVVAELGIEDEGAAEAVRAHVQRLLDEDGMMEARVA